MYWNISVEYHSKNTKTTLNESEIIQVFETIGFTRLFKYNRLHSSTRTTESHMYALISTWGTIKYNRVYVYVFKLNG